MENFTCFLIDDDPDDLEIFTIALADVDKSYKCFTAKNGVEALEFLKANKSFVPDYIFVDLNMPFLSGIQCLREIKKIPYLVQVPIIIYTTSGRETDVEEARQFGASHFFIKPSSIRALSKILSGLFQKQSLPFLLE